MNIIWHTDGERANMLCNSTEFSVHNMTISQSVKKRSFAVIHMAHYGDCVMKWFMWIISIEKKRKTNKFTTLIRLLCVKYMIWILYFQRYRRREIEEITHRQVFLAEVVQVLLAVVLSNLVVQNLSRVVCWCEQLAHYWLLHGNPTVWESVTTTINRHSSPRIYSIKTHI